MVVKVTRMDRVSLLKYILFTLYILPLKSQIIVVNTFAEGKLALSEEINETSNAFACLIAVCKDSHVINPCNLD